MPLQTFTLVVAFIFGITIGSFLNVVIWRLPRGGSLVEPQWSYCPSCNERLVAKDLVPVFSFLLLKRRCRYCKQPISWRYPGIELLTGLLFVLVAWYFGATVDTIFFCLFMACMICVFFIDMEHFVIPDGLNVFGVLIGIAHNITAIGLHEPGQYDHVGSVHIPASIMGALGYAAVLYTIGLMSYVFLVSLSARRKSIFAASWEYTRDNVVDWAWITVYYVGAIIPPLRRFAEPPEPLEGVSAEEIESDEEAGGLGGGDGKLAAAIGANLFFPHAAQSLLWAVVLGALFGVVVLIRERRSLGGRTAIPFGPWMVTGALVAMFWGNSIVGWYVKSFLPSTPPTNSQNNSVNPGTNP